MLTKMAELNGKKLPSDIKLVPDVELASTEDQNLSLYQKLKIAIANWHISRSLIGMIMIGISLRFFLTGISFVKTELIYLNGQNGDSLCNGERSKTYFLTSKDYLLLLGFQVSSDIITCITLVYFNRINIGLRTAGIICYGTCFAIFCAMFTCPNAWVGIGIFSVVQILNYNLAILMLLNMSGLFLFIANSFLPFRPKIDKVRTFLGSFPSVCTPPPPPPPPPPA